MNSMRSAATSTVTAPLIAATTTVISATVANTATVAQAVFSRNEGPVITSNVVKAPTATISSGAPPKLCNSRKDNQGLASNGPSFVPLEQPK